MENEKYGMYCKTIDKTNVISDIYMDPFTGSVSFVLESNKFAGTKTIVLSSNWLEDNNIIDVEKIFKLIK